MHSVTSPFDHGEPPGLGVVYSRGDERWVFQHWRKVKFDTAPQASDQVAWIPIRSHAYEAGSVTTWRVEGSSYVLVGPGTPEQGVQIARSALQKYAAFE